MAWHGHEPWSRDLCVALVPSIASCHYTILLLPGSLGVLAKSDRAKQLHVRATPLSPGRLGSRSEDGWEGGGPVSWLHFPGCLQEGLGESEPTRARGKCQEAQCHPVQSPVHVTCTSVPIVPLVSTGSQPSLPFTHMFQPQRERWKWKLLTQRVQC